MQQRQVADIPAIGSLGLFSPGLDLIPGSFAKSDETVTDPLRKALSALRSLASRGQQQRGPFTPSQPTEVIDRLLDDLDEGTRGNPTAVAVQNQGIKSIDTSQIAAMSITFEVI